VGYMVTPLPSGKPTKNGWERSTMHQHAMKMGKSYGKSTISTGPCSSSETVKITRGYILTFGDYLTFGWWKSIPMGYHGKSLFYQ
jgi:hypothetical protein